MEMGVFSFFIVTFGCGKGEEGERTTATSNSSSSSNDRCYIKQYRGHPSVLQKYSGTHSASVQNQQWHPVRGANTVQPVASIRSGTFNKKKNKWADHLRARERGRAQPPRPATHRKAVLAAALLEQQSALARKSSPKLWTPLSHFTTYGGREEGGGRAL